MYPTLGVWASGPTLFCARVQASSLARFCTTQLGNSVTGPGFALSLFCLLEFRWFTRVLTSCPLPLAVGDWASCPMPLAFGVLGSCCAAGSRHVLLYLWLPLGLFSFVSPFPGILLSPKRW